MRLGWSSVRAGPAGRTLLHNIGTDLACRLFRILKTKDVTSLGLTLSATRVCNCKREIHRCKH